MPLERLPDSTDADVSSGQEADEVPADEEIYCPLCGYNLTANLAGRCSECGSLFNRDQLLELRYRHFVSLMPWEQAEDMGVIPRLWRTLRISLLRPKEFALAFAVQPRNSRSTSFYAICLAVVFVFAFTIDWTADLMPRRGFVGFFVAFFVVPIPVTNIVVGVMYAVLYPHADRRRHLAPWRAIIEYASAHWLLWCLAPIPVVLFGLINWDMVSMLVIACTASFWIGCSILWAFTLVEVVRWRTSLGQRQTRALGLTLLVGWATWGACCLLLVRIGEWMRWI
ncbi:MAG: hypothetical protein JXQ73_24515 [Phycisphaerae bacterium]|nr:hypothetical protein [Phycisphaerae bacterium]